MGYNDLAILLEELVPDELILDSLHGVLRTALVDGMYDVEVDEEMLHIPPSTHVVITTRALFKEYLPLEGFGDFKVEVSLGSVSGTNGFLKSEYCFATLYFNDEARLITCDFHSEWR